MGERNWDNLADRHGFEYAASFHEKQGDPLVHASMTLFSRLALVLLVLLTIIRSVGFCAYGFYQVCTPLEVHPLESKMVHLAWRVQAGETLYPDWTTVNHVSNFFGPCYFTIVGFIGKIVNADLNDLLIIGRAVTIIAVVLASLVLGLFTGRRWGRIPGFLGFAFALGGAPLVGFGIMVRPDVLADLLGFTGFVVLGYQSESSVQRRTLGIAFLVSAMMTKQTAAVYLIASSVALACNGQTRTAVVNGAITLFILALVIGLSMIVAEPRIFVSMLGESRAPISGSTFRIVWSRLWDRSPEIPFFVLAGFGFWLVGPRADRGLASLTAVIATLSVLSTLKLGADLNYYLGLRLVGGLGAAQIAGEVLRDCRRGGLGEKICWFAAVALVGLGTVVSVKAVVYAQSAFVDARDEYRDQRSFQGRAKLEQYQLFFELASDPDHTLLTDCGPIALRQRDRAPFADPWLFHLLVESGRIVPSSVIQQLQDREYEWVITTSDLLGSDYLDNPFGLPEPVAQVVRSQYEPIAETADLFVYQPRLDSVLQSQE